MYRSQPGSSSSGSSSSTRSITAPLRDIDTQSRKPSDEEKVQGAGDFDSRIPEPAVKWKQTLDKVVKSVVSLRYIHTKDFDAQSPGTQEGTGFVVDKEKGYILTNRHVVGTGPFWGYCTFANHEECDVRVAYYDPIHDFAFLRYDTTSIKHADIVALKLKPEAVQVGAEVKVVGNDSGNVLSIASAVISRLDRNAPGYSGIYSDFNTNYIQASAASKGGSSGSPVVNVEGYAVALQAGGTSGSAAINFFLPLQRVKRALHLLRSNKPISRGTFQTVWKLQSFDVCSRLGLSSQEESMFRNSFPDTHSMLTVHLALHNGPADGKLQAGDLLLKINGVTTTKFVDLEDILDSHVGESLALQIRRGDSKIDVELKVDDLYVITPKSFVIVAGAHFHDISFVLARYLSVECRGVFCTETGMVKGLDWGALIYAVDHIPTPDLQTFTEVIRHARDKQNVRFSYRRFGSKHALGTVFASISTSEHLKLKIWTRDDNYEKWSLTEMDYQFGRPVPTPKTGAFSTIEGLTNPKHTYVTNTYVSVSCLPLVEADGMSRSAMQGNGLILDAKQGIVLVARVVVPHFFCQILINVANIDLSAEVLFLHPSHGYALLKYDPELVDGPAASLRLSKLPAKVNSQVTCIYPDGHNSLTLETRITGVSSRSVPLPVARPINRGFNIHTVSVEPHAMGFGDLGAILDSNGLVQAMLIRFLSQTSRDEEAEEDLGLHASELYPVVERVRKGRQSNMRMLEVEVRDIGIVPARKLGVDEKWIERMIRESKRLTFFIVHRITILPPGPFYHHGDKLKHEDVVLSLNGKLVTDTRPFGNLYQAARVSATVLRDGQELELDITTVPIANLETDRVVVFQGLVLHKPHWGVRQVMGKLPSEVYVNYVEDGSPGSLYGMSSLFITHVNDIETPDLDAFLRATEPIPDNVFFRLRTNSIQLNPGLVTMKKCNHYFPLRSYGIEDGSVTCYDSENTRHKDGRRNKKRSFDSRPRRNVRKD